MNSEHSFGSVRVVTFKKKTAQGRENLHHQVLLGLLVTITEGLAQTRKQLPHKFAWHKYSEIQVSVRFSLPIPSIQARLLMIHRRVYSKQRDLGPGSEGCQHVNPIFFEFKRLEL